MAKNNKRSSSWCFILYPESAPEDWRKMLKALLIPVAISPLHSIAEDNETEIKPHHHIYLHFDSLKSFDQVAEITAGFNATIPQIVHSPRALIRYFCHLDDPQKEQFDISEIISLSGFDVFAYVLTSEGDTINNVDRIIDIIDNNELYEFCDLVAFLVKGQLYNEFITVRHNASFFQYYITSRRFKADARNKFRRITDDH